MDDAHRPWTLDRFVDVLDVWVENERPPERIRITVTAQIFSRMETPYRGVTRVEGHDNLWFGVVPDSHHGEGMVVTWCYRIFESSHSVRCDMIESLPTPI